ncbi:uncharacterized protein TRAVEDRAFT_26192 [Trametes versicolor FP-101664 SS1]|uniref:uncharacterized protein n=1 Tax=Trametes versicolor (strain FP-101664) TaxID=717944 RepID=UPI00046248D0|nr:uncharacterized protein TRAVEDRAFT_26192 [Trametes versicolor FP-101664 SS1]EIW62413.1 hypothetical protein TRAVEDRAFT_26192 [Trametes versicolor FP-101664 SS1]
MMFTLGNINFADLAKLQSAPAHASVLVREDCGGTQYTSVPSRVRKASFAHREGRSR